MAKLSAAYIQLYKNGKTFNPKKHDCPSCWMSRKRLVKMQQVSDQKRTFECPKCGLIVVARWNRCKW